MGLDTIFATRIARMKASEIRELLKLLDRPGILSFAGGIPDPALFPSDAFAAAFADVLSGNKAGQALQYSVSEGYTPAPVDRRADGRDRRALYGGQYPDHLGVATGAGLSGQAVPVAGRYCAGGLTAGQKRGCAKNLVFAAHLVCSVIWLSNSAERIRKPSANRSWPLRLPMGREGSSLLMSGRSGVGEGPDDRIVRPGCRDHSSSLPMRSTVAISVAIRAAAASAPCQ